MMRSPLVRAPIGLLVSATALVVALSFACAQKTEKADEQSASTGTLVQAKIVYYAMPG